MGWELTISKGLVDILAVFLRSDLLPSVFQRRLCDLREIIQSKSVKPPSEGRVFFGKCHGTGMLSGEGERAYPSSGEQGSNPSPFIRVPYKATMRLQYYYSCEFFRTLLSK